MRCGFILCERPPKTRLSSRTVLVVANKSKSGREPIDRGIFEWLKVCQHFSCLRVIPFAQFSAQLQQPGQSIGTLKTGATFSANVNTFLFQIFGSKTFA